MFPSVSVIMSVWNGQAYLDEAIESVRAQTVTDFDFVIIDDGSTDRTSEMLSTHQARDPRISVTRRPHSGMVSSFNFASKAARGEYIAHLDADDVSLPDRLEKQLTFMMANPSIGALGGAVRTIWPDGGVIRDTAYPTNDAEIRLELAKAFCFCHSALVFRKDVFTSVGGYRTAFEFAEDLDLMLRLAEHCELANLDSVLSLYRIHGNQVCARNVEQQILAAIGARLAAKIRSQGRSDESYFEEQHLSRAMLKELGATDEEINHQTLLALEHHLRFALAPNLPAGFEGEVEAVIKRIQEFCTRCDSRSIESGDFPLITKVLAQEVINGANLASMNSQ
jgi:glycosyltransferase involved in cell wall biosynthesis